jgi:hypothetical protein
VSPTVGALNNKDIEKSKEAERHDARGGEEAEAEEGKGKHETKKSKKAKRHRLEC